MLLNILDCLIIVIIYRYYILTNKSTLFSTKNCHRLLFSRKMSIFCVKCTIFMYFVNYLFIKFVNYSHNKNSWKLPFLTHLVIANRIAMKYAPKKSLAASLSRRRFLKVPQSEQRVTGINYQQIHILVIACIYTVRLTTIPSERPYQTQLSQDKKQTKENH